MAAENAANARPPPKAALGPEFRASIPPATNPAATEFVISFLARYYCQYKSRLMTTVEFALTPSITHSVPAKSAPTLPKPLPLLHIPFPMSLKISFAFCPVFRPACVCCRNNGSSYANEADIREKNAPIAKPVKISIYSSVSRLGYP
jgi:hypothetical protein